MNGSIATILLLLSLTFNAQAAEARHWGFQVGLLAGLGASDFAGTAKPPAPPTNPTNLFAIYPPSNTATQEAQLSGLGGIGLRLDWRQWLSLRLEVAQQGRTYQMKETLTFPTGTVLKRNTAWEWALTAFPLLLDVGWVIVLGEKASVRPHVGGGAYYAHTSSTRKLVGAEGFSASEVTWAGAPPDDHGWIAVAGIDFIHRNSQGMQVPLLNLECRFSRGDRQLDPVAGVDLASQAIEGVISFPLWVLGNGLPKLKMKREDP